MKQLTSKTQGRSNLSYRSSHMDDSFRGLGGKAMILKKKVPTSHRTQLVPTEKEEDLLLSNMDINISLSKESMGKDHLEVPESWVMDNVGQLGGRIMASPTCNITPELLDISTHKVTHR